MLCLSCKIDDVRSSVKQINEARHADGQEGKVSKPDNDPHMMGEAKTAMDDVLDMNDNSCDMISLKGVAMLNASNMKPTNVTMTSNCSESLSVALAVLVSRF